MTRKFFPHDKNYLLESAQLSLRRTLLSALLDKVKKTYELQHNPLLLEDSFFLKIRNYVVTTNLDLLDPFYQNLAAAYRFKHGENQLEFLWNGQDHHDKYEREWSAAFELWTTSFCQNEQFLKAILDLTVFLPPAGPPAMGENRMNYFIQQFLEIRFHRHNGLVKIKVA